MKKLLLILALVSGTASAEWVARAESPYAWGVGYSNNLFNAQQIALRECAMRTPVGWNCFIVSQYWR